MSEYPGDDGKHQVVLSFSGAEAHDAVLDYVKATNGKDLSFEKKVHFPLVKVAYADDATVDGIPQVMSATITDPWDAAVYTGDDTSQAVCMNAGKLCSICIRSFLIHQFDDISCTHPMSSSNLKHILSSYIILSLNS